jgi:hypothetical protein
MSETVDDYEAFCNRLTASGSAAMGLEFDDVPAVADLIECARAYLRDCDLDAAEDGRLTSDEEPVQDLASAAAGMVRQGMLANDQDLLAIGFSLLEKLHRRLNCLADAESTMIRAHKSTP